MEENMNHKVYHALDIAKYVINKCTCEKKAISNLQLQKILYYLQKEYLVKYGYPLFSEDMYARTFGPVVPDIYFLFCGHGSTTITLKYDIVIDTNDTEKMDPIIEDKREKHPWDLVYEVHAKGKPWYITYRNGLGDKRIIPKELIKTKGKTDIKVWKMSKQMDIFSALPKELFAKSSNEQISRILVDFKRAYEKYMRNKEINGILPKFKYHMDSEDATIIQLSASWDEGNANLYFAFEKDENESSFGTVWNDNKKKNFESRCKSIEMNDTDDIIHEALDFIFKISEVSDLLR